MIAEVHKRNADVPAEVIEAEVAEAVRAVRAEMLLERLARPDRQ